jgi:NADH dehydrogenase FAD-containing subunit/uncharacterized membrane protein YphA (DoxX/SURF4 family)
VKLAAVRYDVAARSVTRFARMVTAVLASFAPWIALLIRVALAQAFLRDQLAQLMLGAELDAPLGSQWWLRAAHHLAASDMGTVVQAICPLLLLAGLFARPAAIAMLLETVFLPPTAMTSDLGLLWLSLLAFVVIDGAGSLSFDRLFARGVAETPVPFAGSLAAAYRFLSLRVAPFGLFGLRLVAAAAALPVGRLSMGLLQSNSAQAMLSGWMPWGIAVLLAAGLFTRGAATIVLVMTPLAASSPNERLFWALLLALLVVRGGGRCSLDNALQFISRPRRRTPAEILPHVVIVGAGFGGIAAARALADLPCHVTLIDKTNHTLFQPLLYQVATAGLSPAEIATPIRSLFRDCAAVSVILGEVTGVDRHAQLVQCDMEDLAYDYLILATGARHAYFGRDEWAAHAPGLKTVDDATQIRRRLLLAFERAEAATDPVERMAWLTLVVVGGGPTGVELAGAISELARVGLSGEFRRIDPAEARVILVQSAPRVLPAFPEKLSEAALVSLHKLGVEVLLNCKLESLTDRAAIVSGQVLSTRTVLWAAGVMASAAGDWLAAVCDTAGRVKVGPDLSVPGSPNVFVVGDTAAASAWNGAIVPGLAPAAKQGGAYVARVIAARLANTPSPPPFRYRHFGNLATIGREAAVANFGTLRLHGALAWWVWGAAHITFLADAHSRVSVVANWAWAYLTLRRGSRLITALANSQGPPGAPQPYSVLGAPDSSGRR